MPINCYMYILIISQNGDFVSKFPSSVSCNPVLGPTSPCHVTPKSQLTPDSGPGPESIWAQPVHRLDSSTEVHVPTINRYMAICRKNWIGLCAWVCVICWLHFDGKMQFFFLIAHPVSRQTTSPSMIWKVAWQIVAIASHGVSSAVGCSGQFCQLRTSPR